MYVVLDVKDMMATSPHTRKRQQPVKPYNSTLLLRPGTKLDLIPPGSEIRYAYGSWEVHMPLANRTMVKRLAQELNAIAWMTK
jgi:hypothetical protein